VDSATVRRMTGFDADSATARRMTGFDADSATARRMTGCDAGAAGFAHYIEQNLYFVQLSQEILKSPP